MKEGPNLLTEAEMMQLADKAAGSIELDQAKEILSREGMDGTTKCCATGTCS